MTPHPMDQQPSPFPRGIVLGVVIALAFLIVLGGIGAIMVRKQHADVRKGWNLVPVLAASKDLTAGTTLTFGDIVSREIPEQFITPSAMKIGSETKAIGQVLQNDLIAGDPIHFSDLPAVMKPVVLARRDLPVGTTISADDLEQRPISAELITDSWAIDPTALRGRLVRVAFLKGDPILLPHLAP